ncbi:LysR substrate-binding domain-containing protein [uncultured Desulfovibrio sp.]|uniref:LysR substrate-binding domain-containing protein n=1 Tax=uncultured Desulfovibrio sp. TaxID=167968 RepID=UPI00286848E4|nr:LysR substrate-binding domain-containing protein [uncultured Desulfovibrio sp.]
MALPLDAAGVHLSPLPYAEPLLAALPAAWVAGLPHAGNGAVKLQDLNGRPLFWFRRENNPAYFDHMRGIFTHVGFAPVYLEEPEEHDVLLARIAQGDGMGMLPRSFSAIGRRDVVFCPLAEGELLELRLGLALQVGGDYGTDGSAHEGDEPETTSRLPQIIAEAAHFLGMA